MDMSNNPRVNSVVLTGLDLSMKPELVRFEGLRGYVKPFPDIKVMHLIKSLAVMVYNQEKLTPYYHKNVCDGRNTLAYFICAMHRQSAPQPMTTPHSHQHPAANNVTVSGYSNTPCPLETPGKQCDLPILSTTSMLPLGYWDSLYYAVVAEIRLLRQDLEQRFGFACEEGDPVLHEQGTEENTNQPVTAIDLAVMLENAWYALMDNRLVAALDDAVGRRMLQEIAAQEEVDNASRQLMDDIRRNETGGATNIPWERERKMDRPPPSALGLIDVNELEPEMIIDLLWTKHAPEVSRACAEEIEEDWKLTAYGAQLYAREMDAAVPMGTTILPSAVSCSCHPACICKLRCNQFGEQCTCVSGRAQIYRLVHEQEAKKSEMHANYVEEMNSVPNRFLGAATNGLAQMEVAALANRDPVAVKAVRIIHDANNAQQVHIAKQLRERSNTNDSQLAYVRPLRAPKDTQPLGFYRDYSPQRYPKIPRPGGPPMQPDDMYGSSLSQVDMPTRKPAPPPISTAGHLHYHDYSRPRNYKYGPTPPSSSPYDATTFAQAGQVLLPSSPGPQGQGPIIRRFPAKSIASAPDVATAFTGPKTMPANYFDPAGNYIGLLSRHPSTLEHDEQAAEPFPSIYRQPLFGAPKQAASASTLPSLKTLQMLGDKPQPALPRRDVVSPKPAVKQRYVSAGGPAKFSERPEVPAPALLTGPSLGGKITKEELDAKMNDPEFLRRTFGEAAVAMMDPFSTPRKSADTNKHTSGRKSNDGDHHNDTDKRDRTSSSASRRLAKLKRVFSSKTDGQDDVE